MTDSTTSITISDPASTWSPKVKVPLLVTGAIGPSLMILAAFGIDPPVSEDQIVGAIGAVILVIQFVNTLVGWWVKDPLRNG